NPRLKTTPTRDDHSSCPPPLKRQAVKRHHHKHNLKHRYEFKETLGKGTYGKVKKAVDRSGRMVAIKSIRKENIKDEQDLMHIRREIEIMSSLNHPYIITIYEVFENKDKIVIVMEYASRGDLFEYISERQISERESRHFFRQIVSAINSSVKLVLNANDHKIVIADFGLSNLFRRGEYLQTYCGSPLYASPEIVNGRPYKGPEVDSWSLGVLLYTLVHGTMPFDGLDYKSLVRQISTGDYHKPAKPSDACGLIRWMLMVNPERRATLEEIASHWWLNWGYQQPLLAESKKAAVAEMSQVTGTATAPQMGGSTRIADWLRRTSRPLLQSGSKMRCLLRPAGSAGGDVAITRQRSIRKSRKENDVSQSMQESAVLRPFKGILKKRGSLKQKLPGEVQAPPLEEKTTNTVGAPPPLPRKGILKKPVERESGYYSSSAESSGPAHTPQHRACPSMLPRQKGILKRHGKFSSSGLQEFESFDRLDLPDRHHPAAMVQHPAGGSTMRGSVSVDNLMDLREDKPTGPRKGYWDIDMDCYQSAVGGSTFSIPDCRDVTKVYKLVLNGACTS
uniref:non-specific serine/threonine protein kinase n=1 Tax=Electrophorus electricus TaxID=8005 RepID=A0AAY5E890_ELEEL